MKWSLQIILGYSLIDGVYTYKQWDNTSNEFIMHNLNCYVEESISSPICGDICYFNILEVSI